MGIATLRKIANGNRRKINRFFALFALLGFTTSTLILLFAVPASAAATYDWVNEAVIEGKGVPIGWHPSTTKDYTVRFVDSNPNDTNRTFKDVTTKEKVENHCSNDVVDTITLSTPTSGTLSYVSTAPTTDTIMGDLKIHCDVKTTGITIGSVNNGKIEALPCTFTGPNAEERCAAQKAQSNKEWVRLCSYVGIPGAPTPPPGSFCAGAIGGTPAPPGSETPPTGTTRAPDPCDSLGEFSMRWIACPVLVASTKFAEAMDGVIESQLHYDTTIFDRNSDQGKAYYAAWTTFRNIALALVLIAGLIMVVSQGTGIQIFDAYTVKKVMPRLLVAVIGITLCWPLLQLIVTFFNDAGHLIEDIILWPFQEAARPTNGSAAADITGVATALTAAVVGGGAYLIRLGPAGIMALVGTVVLALFVGLLVIMARNVILTVAILFAPLAIACYILPNTKKVFDFWQNALLTALIIFLIIMALIGAGKAMSLASQDGIMKVLLFILPYFFLPFAFKLAGGLMNTVFSLFDDKSKGIFGGLSNMRKNIGRQRTEQWMDGGLGGGHRLMEPINALGRRVGAAKEGGGVSAFMPTRRGRAGRALFQGTVNERAMKRNAFLQQLQQDDDANGVLAASGGTLAGAEAAARDLFTDEKTGEYDRARGERAIAAARATGLNHANALAAAQTAMRNKARAFAPGNVRAVDNMVRRLARSEEEYTSLAQAVAYNAREGGRLDLGGTDWIDYRKDKDAWIEARATAPGNESKQWRVIADRTMLDGIGRSGVQAMMAGHTNQAKQAINTLGRILTDTTAAPQKRLQAAMIIKEFQGAMPGASADVRDVLNKELYGKGSTLDLNPEGNIADQLAQMTGIPKLTGQGLTTMGRTYAEYVNDPASRGIAPAPGQK